MKQKMILVLLMITMLTSCSTAGEIGRAHV